MFDLQRNLLTTLLAAGIGVLVVAGGAIAMLMGRPDVAAIEPQGSTEAAEVEVDVPQTGLEEFASYSAIIERPVFFSDRQLPIVEAPGDEEQMAVDEEAVEEVQDLKAALAGVVITPEMKLAMVSDEQAGKTFVLREGMSLEGEQAAWKLDAIQARQVSFVSVDGRQADLELKVNTAGLDAPAPPVGASDASQQQGAQPQGQQAEQPADQRQASEEARARAEEIRRRVAERRAQLRAEAERRARQRQEQQDNNG
jgi:general secretion pathway protein N